MESTLRNVDENGFPCGAIISIQLINFMVYNNVTFHMHPKLNMIVAPNGSGKSTIVCAIVIGLGASPKLTGRGNEIYDYVQHGKQKAITKITLSMGKDEPPAIVRRVINKANHTNDFQINKKKVTLALVEIMLSKLHIQVDNICQFLPQEKVSSLAAMDNIQLLHEVQLAAGSDDMVEKHEDLKKLDTQLNTTESTIVHLEERIRVLTAKNESIRTQYQSFQSRLDLMKKSSLNTILLCTVEYDLTKDQLKRCNQDRKTLEHQYKALLKKLEPMETDFKEDRSNIQSMKQHVKTYSDRLDQWVRRCQGLQMQCNKLTQDQETMHYELERLKRNSQQLIQLISDFTRDKKELEQRLSKQDVSESDVKALENIDRKLNELNHQLTDVHLQKYGLNEQENRLVSKMKECQEGKNQVQKQLQELQARKAYTIQILKAFSEGRVGLEAYQWIESNRSKFQSEVRGPMLLSIQVLHASLGHYVEAAVGRNLLLNTFVVDNEADYETLCHQFVENPNRHERKHISIHLHTLQPRKPAFSMDVLRPIGFEGVLSDVIVTDEFTKNWLLERTNVDSVPYALQDVHHDLIAKQPSITRYFANHTSFILKRDEADPTHFANTTRPLDPNRTMFHVGHAQRAEEIQQLESKSHHYEQEFEKLREETRLVRQTLEANQTQAQSIQEEKHAFLEQKREFNQKREKQRHLQRDLERIEKELVEKQNKLVEVESKIKEKSKHIQTFLLRKLDTFEPLVEWFQQLPMLYKEKRIQLLQVAVLEHQLAERMQVYRDTREEKEVLESKIETTLREITTIREQATMIRSQYQTAAAEIKVDQKEVLDTMIEEEQMALDLSSKTLQEQHDFLKRRGEEFQAQLTLLPSADLDLIHVYEDRVKEIVEYEQEKTSIELQKTQQQEERRQVSQAWEQELEKLIETVSTYFSSYFSQIGCAGEVALQKAAFFKNYALQIRVKFRAAQEFQVLDKARQSGGERAVSTILFLLSLQKFSKAPFRLVDEINQGMDVRNERLIHTLLVDAASQSDAPQYFLITPKLLFDLKYSEQMRVHSIMNGNWIQAELLDPEQSYSSTSDYIQKRKSLKESMQ